MCVSLRCFNVILGLQQKTIFAMICTALLLMIHSVCAVTFTTASLNHAVYKYAEKRSTTGATLQGSAAPGAGTEHDV